ncbi:response regulator transcription factor [Seongchinamella unica]|uniref:Response regulator transcription factor n=1 Tax=Seongchinamella unica TaxID=2547392 RepID=A0A4R5LP12_9GAMM|nr:response regulator transcription factor [Seongchinamella unica]TDG12064.1 response regulator transcription factor [Seongchinamella unica]
MNVLLVEDDEGVARFICSELERAGVACIHCVDGDEAFTTARDQAFDVWIVDRMLPSRDGLSLIQDLRESGNETPALILSALGEVDDRVQGLRSGADDYLVKPFAMEELLARLQVLSRRAASSGDGSTRLQVGDLVMDLLRQEVSRQGQPLPLQPREYKLLEYLMRHAGQVVTRAMLLEHVWGYNFDPQTNVIDVHVSRLRQKIDRGFDVPLLLTVRGAGYRLGPESD